MPDIKYFLYKVNKYIIVFSETREDRSQKYIANPTNLYSTLYSQHLKKHILHEGNFMPIKTQVYKLTT